MAVTAFCSWSCVALDRIRLEVAAAWSSPEVIVNEPEEAGVVLIEMRNWATLRTDAVEVLAVAFVDCAQLSGVMNA